MRKALDSICCPHEVGAATSKYTWHACVCGSNSLYKRDSTHDLLWHALWCACKVFCPNRCIPGTQSAIVRVQQFHTCVDCCVRLQLSHTPACFQACGLGWVTDCSPRTRGPPRAHSMGFQAHVLAQVSSSWCDLLGSGLSLAVRP